MQQRHIILALVVIAKFILQFILIHPVYELHRDEFLHLDQGKHLAWGYISVPPVTSWISYIIHMLGGSETWVKFFPALLGALTIFITWKIIIALKGGVTALWIGCLAMLISSMLRINSLYQPNSLDIFFWTLLFYCLVRLVQTDQPKWIYAAALTFALGFLSKYNIIFLAVGLIAGLLISGHHRLFLNKHVYFAAAIALIIISPNLLWQIKHDFPTLHQLQELADTQLVNVNRSDFLKDQLLFFINSFFIIVAAWIGLYRYPPLRRIQFVLFTYVTVILLFIVLKAKSYYAIGLYPVLLAIGSVYIEHLTVLGWRRYLRVAAMVLIVVLAIPLFLVAFPNKPPEAIKRDPGLYQSLGMLRWEDGKDHPLPQDFADMLGWKELAAKVDAVYDTLHTSGHTLVLCDNYGQAGAINYYSRFKSIRAVTFSADYIHWFPLESPILNAIRVVAAADIEEESMEAGKFFTSVQRAGQIGNADAREFGTTILVCQFPKMDINPVLEQELRGEIAQ